MFIHFSVMYLLKINEYIWRFQFGHQPSKQLELTAQRFCDVLIEFKRQKHVSTDFSTVLCQTGPQRTGPCQPFTVQVERAATLYLCRASCLSVLSWIWNYFSLQSLIYTHSHLGPEHNSVLLFSCEKQCGSLLKMQICLKGKEAGNDNDNGKFSMHMGKVKPSPTVIL